MLFSKRKGYKPVKKAFQRKSVDEELRNGLWSALKVAVWDQCQWSKPDVYGYSTANGNTVIEHLFIYALFCCRPWPWVGARKTVEPGTLIFLPESDAFALDSDPVLAFLRKKPVPYIKIDKPYR
uniref:HEPN AbiJ-N-terminal domain-containing protein n=1 Tax=Candidatus Kentrum sp. LFY TaxID=2126342 RepID=A0A450V094_9GAMM|nr:MAG: hypothetical protein BECKLFY1418A_GA0070994_10798 [Candidatus Kentron sp. LFY]